MSKKFLKNIEWSILICVGILIAIGCVALCTGCGFDDLFTEKSTVTNCEVETIDMKPICEITLTEDILVEEVLVEDIVVE